MEREIKSALAWPSIVETETATQRVWRHASARRIAELELSRVFALLKSQIGLEDTRREFERFVDARRAPKSNRGASDPDRDRYLIGVFDQLSEANSSWSRSKITSDIARTLCGDNPGRDGSNVKALEKRILRLVEKRNGTNQLKRPRGRPDSSVNKKLRQNADK